MRSSRALVAGMFAARWWMVAAVPVLKDIPSPVVTETEQSRTYFSVAKAAYGQVEYAACSGTVVSKELPANSNDVPSGVVFAWTGRGPFVLEVSNACDFSGEDTRVERTDEQQLTLFNFFADTTYYWRVSDVMGSWSRVGIFKTAPGIRQIRGGQLRNVRDIGGWTGLRQGMVYRGSAWRYDAKNGEVGPSAETMRVYRDILHIRTDIDLREDALPLKTNDVDVTLFGARRVVCGVSATTNDLFGAQRNFVKPLRLLADSKNYPVYIHCSGGADRTGAVIFLIEAICGVSDIDKEIDFESTTHASIFDIRKRCNRTDEKTFQYGTVYDTFQKYPGRTLNEKVAYYARTALGLTDAEIGAIRSILINTTK